MLVRCTATLLSWQSEALSYGWAFLVEGGIETFQFTHFTQIVVGPYVNVPHTASGPKRETISQFLRYDTKIAWAVCTSFPDLTVTLGALMCSPSIFSLESFLMQRFERFVVL